MDVILRLLPPELKRKVTQALDKRWEHLQEIRIRINRPLEFVFDHDNEIRSNLIASESDGKFLLNQLSEFSLYRLEEELKQGYITIEGGHRVGLAGKVNVEAGKVKAIRNVSGFNIRIAKEKIGCADSLFTSLFPEKIKSTLLIGEPKSGKTTLLRDLSRIIGSGTKHLPSYRVGIVDERSEIAGSVNGVPQHQVGVRTDVMDACPKAEGMMMMIRSMSPEVLIVDEIGSHQDVEAIEEAMHAGITLICSIHGSSIEQIQHRPSIRRLIERKAFQRYVMLPGFPPNRSPIHIYNQDSTIIRSVKEGNPYAMDRSRHPSIRYNLDRL
ncbi:stage III sporulation protein AA [Bacillaceae bacterium S4-13-56]